MLNLRPAALVLIALMGSARAEPRSSPARPAKLSPWQSNQSSFFLASASDVGFIYARPHLTAAYGSPFWIFTGVDAYLLSTNSFAAGYAGWRASLPFLDVQLGWRGVYPYDRRFLTPRDSHAAADLSLDSGGQRSSYDLAELEITALAPLLGGFALGELHPLWIDAPRDVHLYEELIRAVVEPPFAMRTRLGYLRGVGPQGAAKLGGLVEHLILPGRPKDVTRVGPLLVVSFTQYFEGLFTVTVPVRSPDALGLYEGSYGFLGVRWRWARRF